MKKKQNNLGYIINVTTQLHFPSHKELIRFMREKAKLTQGQLAKKIRTTQSAIARLEKTKRLPTLTTLQKISEVCGFSIQAPYFACKKCDKNISDCKCKRK